MTEAEIDLVVKSKQINGYNANRKSIQGEAKGYLRT
jgi:hypothetical protein